MIVYDTDNYASSDLTRGVKVEADNVYAWEDSLLWVKASHSFKFGYNGQVLEYFTIWNRGTAGEFHFNRLETAVPGVSNGTSGNSYASFLLGAVDNAVLRTNTGVLRSYPSHTFYALDDWKISPRLTQPGLSTRGVYPHARETRPGLRVQSEPGESIREWFSRRDGVHGARPRHSQRVHVLLHRARVWTARRSGLRDHAQDRDSRRLGHLLHSQQAAGRWEDWFHRFCGHLPVDLGKLRHHARDVLGRRISRLDAASEHQSRGRSGLHHLLGSGRRSLPAAQFDHLEPRDLAGPSRWFRPGCNVYGNQGHASGQRRGEL